MCDTTVSDYAHSLVMDRNIYPDGYGFGLMTYYDDQEHYNIVVAYAVYPDGVARHITFAEADREPPAGYVLGLAYAEDRRRSIAATNGEKP